MYVTDVVNKDLAIQCGVVYSLTYLFDHNNTSNEGSKFKLVTRIRGLEDTLSATPATGQQAVAFYYQIYYFISMHIIFL